ncbi:MAG: ATP-binding protein [Ferruginibacter sp.]
MQTSIPKNEKQRLQALQEYNILDSLPEPEFDEITKIASYVCNTPISLISLIDDKRQFFKSGKGMNISEPPPKDVSFCVHAINIPEEIMIIPDSRLDDRFADNPLVTGDPHVIFYAGIPLVNPSGYALGTLCIIDNKPGNLSPIQIEILKGLGNQVVKLFELRKANVLLLDSQRALENYSEQMKSFAYMASHDLKEPARMVNSFLHLLQNSYSDKLDDKAKKYIEFASDGAKRMTILIDELLTYSLADNVNKTVEKVNIADILNKIIALNKGIIQQSGAVISFGAMPVIESIKTTVEIIFRNLIANALKYQAPGVKPIVEISYIDKGSHWKFAVIDNGIGIDKEYHEQIFQLFKRLHTKEEYAGTGLGLATCKKTAETLGGSIWIKSEAGSGSTFYFTIPKHLN